MSVRTVVVPLHLVSDLPRSLRRCWHQASVLLAQGGCRDACSQVGATLCLVSSACERPVRGLLRRFSRTPALGFCSSRGWESPIAVMLV